jgi:hypothetical protein
MTLAWYVSRLRSMGAREVVWRARNVALQHAWRRRHGAAWPVPPVTTPRWSGGLLPECLAADPAEVRALGMLAEQVLAGSWRTLSAPADLSGTDPDWFRDPRTSLQTPADSYAFDVPYRDAARVGNVKHLWEMSRLQHITLLAAAHRLTGDLRFADRAAAHLRSWWQANPPLCGIHWVSGIELGLRLVCWVWARRLLAGYPGVAGLFEANPTFQRQLHAHQAWLAALHSRGTSANNHLLAEMVGLLSASLAFPLFQESPAWAALAAGLLETECERQTFADGLNRELAFGYHIFVLELLLVAGCEADAAGRPMSDQFWRVVRRMADALAASVDTHLQPPRQGDADDGRALLLSAGTRSPTEEALEACAALLGPAPWWPRLREGGLAACLLSSIARRRNAGPECPAFRPNSFPAAGISILRDTERDTEEMWCRFDHGPHGFLATAAHAHADALSFELRIGGQQLLIDPGTYCYHDEAAWRAYFRSTIAHNALELLGHDSAAQAGPFLWSTHPAAQRLLAEGLDGGPRASVVARHEAYRDGQHRVMHRRRLVLDRTSHSLEVLDEIEAPRPLPARLAFHLHPDVTCDLAGHIARFTWTADGTQRAATMTLPDALSWSAHRGDTDPILGWFSGRFGEKQPTTTLLGVGSLAPGQVLRSRTVVLPAATATPKERMRVFGG